MKFDLPAWHAEITKTLDATTNLQDGMHALLAYCNKKHRWKGWSKIGELNFDSDLAKLEKWLKGVLKNEPPPNSIKAFWFGIFNPISNGKAVCDTYLAGTKAFDPEDETFEWACEPDYFPEGRYAQSEVLRTIYQTVDGSAVSQLGEYVLCLGYTAFAVRELTQRIDKKLWLGKSKQRGLAVGFDSGDGVLLESLGRVTD